MQSVISSTRHHHLDFWHSSTSRGNDKETIVSLRKDALSPVFYFSIVQLASGVLAFVLGIAVTVLGAGSGRFPFTTGYGIWTGAVVVVGGIAGVLTTRCDVNYYFPPPSSLKQRAWAYLGFCVSGIVMSGISLGYSIVAASELSEAKNDPSSPYSHASQLHGLIIIVIILSVTMTITSLYGVVFVTRNRKLFGFFSSDEHDLFKHVSSLGNKVDTYHYRNKHSYGSSEAY
ncbi:hypothetical protein FSP39_007517 [Pinctada imbricata]|uniref:Uncharacterized protein n=1 Tax=Pinctada imbricata TaxID=66713 RepID=A0AA88XZN5_PINIB|nr:hypothetical protein FSP39_007517 [Pinctada imbricata]